MAGEASEALGPQRVWAGAWKLTGHFPRSAPALRSMEKVPANANEYDGEPPATRLCRLANDWADQLAKRAVDLHPSEADAVRTHLQTVWQDATTAARVLAATASIWPAAVPLPSNEERPTSREARAVVAENLARRRREAADAKHSARAAKQAAAASTHTWIQVGSFTRCAACLGRESADLDECAGFPEAMLRWIQQARSFEQALALGVLHDRNTGDGEVLPCLFCRSCGAWTSAALQQRRGLLLSQCRRVAARAGCPSRRVSRHAKESVELLPAAPVGVAAGSGSRARFTASPPAHDGVLLDVSGTPC